MRHACDCLVYQTATILLRLGTSQQKKHHQNGIQQRTLMTSTKKMNDASCVSYIETRLESHTMSQSA